MYCGMYPYCKSHMLSTSEFKCFKTSAYFRKKDSAYKALAFACPETLGSAGNFLSLSLIDHAFFFCQLY